MTDVPTPRLQQDLHEAYTSLAPGLFRYALMLLAHHHEAEDAVQQVFIALAARGVSGIDSLEAYLRRSVRNQCYTRLTQRRVQPLVNGLPLLEPAPEAQVGTVDRLALEEGIRGLPADQREVIHLKVFEGRTLQEIADLTGESTNTIASRYRYAIDKLRAVFGTERHP